MQGLLVAVFLTTIICIPVIALQCLFRKSQKKDTSKQVTYLKRCFVGCIVSLVLIISIPTSGNETTNDTETEDVILEETEEEYKESCIEYNYKEVMRNPENFLGKRIKIIVEVYSVHEKSFPIPKYYFSRSQGEYGLFTGETYCVFDKREDGFKILEKDVIMVYGEIAETQHTSSLILKSEEVFCIDMKYAELISE